MSEQDTCGHCNEQIPLEYTFCPHCGIQLICPNIRTANFPHEQEALENAYLKAKERAIQRGCSQAIDLLEDQLNTSKSILACPISKLIAIAQKPGTFANYYDLMSLQFLGPPSIDGPDWNKLRPQVEIEFMGSHKNIDQLHYACLSTNRTSLSHYGECRIILRDHMIEHRSSVFMENSAFYFFRNGPPIPPGMRSTWANRSKLGTVKLADKITVSTTVEDIATLILRSGETRLDDDFIEVQVFGEMTIHTFERVIITQKPEERLSRKRKRELRGTAGEQSVKDLCNEAGVDWEIS
ncbi:hypothetical protein Pan241w_26250 [Gimesia alba]|uniref:Uncharacterized protein n=1 Tax=Gimesia alba TaxID=2527973 RepID=A0A517RFA7_9PLAN|nr:zinc ribbon domain-containing protein [Gimesia alba]QDT42540.1 hypothetical protein Pan241w_26250 [Gimesia alba]